MKNPGSTTQVSTFYAQEGVRGEDPKITKKWPWPFLLKKNQPKDATT